MGLRLYDDARAFAAALSESSGALYSILNPDRFDPAEILSLAERAARHGHEDLLASTALRDAALREVIAFFDEAGQLDPDWQFAYSSKVVLSIPGWQDLQKLFLARGAIAEGREVLLLVPDAPLRRLVHAMLASTSARAGALPGRRAWARFARTLLRTMLNRADAEPYRTVIFTLSVGAPRHASDPYFGTLPAVLSRHAPTLVVYLASGGTLRLPAGRTRVPFEAFLSPWDVIASWLSALVRGTRAGASPRHARLAPLHAHLRRTEIASGEYFMQRLMRRGFRRMLECTLPETVVYAFENRSFEKHLVAEAHRDGVRAVAYQHSSITPRHLAFRIAPAELAGSRLPHRLVTIGEVTADLLRTSAPALAGRITVGASLRTARQDVRDAATPTVLVAISSSRDEALSLLQATHAAAARTPCAFIVRTHPTIRVDDLYALFQWGANVELSARATLAEDLSRATLVAYSSSTVALEGMLYGRLPLFVDIGDLPSGDPIPGEHAFKLSARDGASLAEAIEHAHALAPEPRQALRVEARTYAERYLRAPTPEALERMAHVMLSA
ncbi:MAG TPA: hypothetical protein VED01_07185 [Burkholderiales bacterium]|nr:hypothetical protein [Burkholderiales bacterium]